MTSFDLEVFVRESNRIEGIRREPTALEIAAHEELLMAPRLRVDGVSWFVRHVANADLREREFMDVRVGSHFPPPGGPHIPRALGALLDQITDDMLTPFEAHVAYETLHPFMDGNGRSGRAVWLWQMQRLGLPVYGSSFLHTAYYQALGEGR